jgi:hypothetical protein
MYLCDLHLPYHLTSGVQHPIQVIKKSVQADSQQYLLSALQHNKRVLESTEAILRKHREEAKSLVETISAFIQRIQDCIRQLADFYEALVSPQKPMNEFVTSTLQAYIHMPVNQLKSLMPEFFGPNDPIGQIPQLKLAAHEEFFFTMEQLLFPIVKPDTRLKIQYEPVEDVVKEYSKPLCRYYSGSMNNKNVNVKILDLSEATNIRIACQQQLQASFPNIVIHIFTTFQANRKQHIITEHWRHTAWNEFFSRQSCKAFILHSKLISFFLHLLKTFEHSEFLLAFTPNVAHITENDEWKIWCPEIVPNPTPYPYCAPEILDYTEEISIPACNLYSIALVILQMTVLVDTADYARLEKKEQEALVMEVKGCEALRSCLVMALMPRMYRKDFQFCREQLKKELRKTLS